MKHVYMSISITLYSIPWMTPDCTYWEKVDDGELISRKLSLDEARRLQWELVKAGGDRAYKSNMFNPAISYVNVDYWARR